DRHQGFHALCDDVGEEHHLAVYMSRRAARRLDQGSLTAQKSLLVRIENADERNFRKIETFTEQIDPNQNVEIGRPQTTQDLDALNGVDAVGEIAHYQTDVVQRVGEVFGGLFCHRDHQNALALFHTLAAKLNRVVD